MTLKDPYTYLVNVLAVTGGVGTAGAYLMWSALALRASGRQGANMASESDAHQSRPVQTQPRGKLSIAQARVLRALSYGGMLTKQQIELAAGLTRWKTQQSIGELTRRDLVFTSRRTGRYEITDLGRTTLAAQHPDFGQLES